MISAMFAAIGFVGVVLLIVASLPEEDENPRKHLSYPRRRFLRKQARKANVS